MRNTSGYGVIANYYVIVYFMLHFCAFESFLMQYGDTVIDPELFIFHSLGMIPASTLYCSVSPVTAFLLLFTSSYIP